jgi:hypothetical protein
MMLGNNYWGGQPGIFLGAAPFAAFFATMLIPLLIWSMLWKGWALWKAARAGSKVWFIALLILNTVGILEILYIFVFGKTSAGKKSSKKK